MSLDGVLVVDKPVGPTSHDVVATARRALRMKRIGHTGTLDPAASGVLPLVVGGATRLARFLSASDKEYDATIRFGVETDTYDITGRIERETGRTPTRESLIETLDRFRGAFDQVPPAYSAKKVEGDRAYELARSARPVVLRAVPVEVCTLDLVSFDPPRARLRLVCSAGFYVRSLAHDLGTAVGTGAALEALVRRRSGEFDLDQAMPFEALAAGSVETVGPRIIPMEGLLLDWPAVELTPEGTRRVAHGQDLRSSDWVAAGPNPAAGHIRLLSPDGRLLALGEPSQIAGFLHPAVVFR